MGKSLAFFISTIIAISAVDWALGTFFDTIYSKVQLGQTGGKINYYLQKKDYPLVIMGNSRALYQINPDSFKVRCFNLSHAGMSQIFQTGLIRVMCNEKRMPSIILLHLEPEEFTFSDKGADIKNLKYYYGRDSLITRYLRKVSRYERFKFLFHLYRYNGGAASILKNYWYSRHTPQDYNGFESITATDRDSANTFYSAGKMEPFKTTDLNSLQIEYLEAFIKVCNKTHTRLICFTSPLFRKPEGMEEVMTKLSSVLARHGIPYLTPKQIDMSSYIQGGWLWRDAHHLNDKGAEIESKLLADWLTKLSKPNP